VSILRDLKRRNVTEIGYCPVNEFARSDEGIRTACGLFARIKHLNPIQLICVNAQSVFDDLIDAVAVGQGPNLEAALPPLTPGREDYWLEGKPISKDIPNFGFHVRRFGSGGQPHTVEVAEWSCNLRGVYGLYAVYALDLNSLGGLAQRPRYVDLTAVPDPGIRIYHLWCVMNALARLNCKNVNLVPDPSRKVTLRKSRSVDPACVWHTIAVGPIHKHPTSNPAVFSTQHEPRLHTVRGVYRSAPNHPIPNFRGHYWIPEHERGNPAFGVVVPEYKVA
jgi:hypothetical protein